MTPPHIEKILFLCLLAFFGHSQALIECNGTSVTKLQLCSLDSDYNSDIPPFKQLGHPMTLKSWLTLLEISEFDCYINNSVGGKLSVK